MEMLLSDLISYPVMHSTFSETLFFPEFFFFRITDIAGQLTPSLPPSLTFLFIKPVFFFFRGDVWEKSWRGALRPLGPL